ncbi:Putative RNA exonuclease NEF-sp [Toxocara canis]|uniref:Putative RNA exonuclease NEF-sp n=1 Tax=Toxocara canis TaxID=6265 RepID=A0A0B2V226_TOXCA|nr:Putative RNA exonuclease NEF-sp [Toxocara canis]
MTPPRPILVIASIPNAEYNFSYSKTVMPDPTRSKRFNLRLRVKIASNDLVQRIECKRKDSFIDEFFGRKSFIRMQKEVTDRGEFWLAILNIPISRAEQIRELVAEGHDPLNSFVSKNLRGSLLMSVEQMANLSYPFPGDAELDSRGLLSRYRIRATKEGHDPLNSFVSKNLRGSLLMSVEQMANLSYPFPGDAELDSRGLLSRYRIRATKEKYFAVKADSPLFAIDCEMCVSDNNGPREHTRITLVDEQCNVVIDTLVKPYDQITDYVTKFSGITKQMLESIDVRLEHVQLALSHILPEDGILVGHSLEYDLRALRLSHPCCIDVALTFNLSGSEKQRSSLKTLTNIFLGETIQDKRGHCSVEDAIATMRLMKMKLDKGFEFGNVSLGWSYGSWARENGLTNSGARLGAKRPLSDNAADEEGGVLEPRPKRNRPSDEKADFERDNNDRQRCGKCGRAMNVECSVQDCKCRNSRASVCVVCCAQRPPKPSEEELGEQLDWSAALGKNSFIGRKPLVEEVMKMKGKSILCCANGQSCSFQSTSRFFYPLGPRCACQLSSS